MALLPLNEPPGASEPPLRFGRGDTNSEIKEDSFRVAGNGPSVSLQAEKTYSSPFCKVTVMFSLTVQVSRFWIRSEKNQDPLYFCIYIFKITASYDPNNCDVITPADRSTGATVMFSVSSVMLRLSCVRTGPRKEKKWI